MRADVYVDGRGNAADTGACAAVLITETQTIESARRLPGEPSNNEAEYEAVLLGMSLAQDAGVTNLTIYSDSQLIVNQVRGLYKVNHDHLRRYRDEVWARASLFQSIIINWVPREKTKRPDALCREIVRPSSTSPRRRPGGERGAVRRANPFVAQ